MTPVGEEKVHDILKRSELEFAQMGEKTMVATAILPNGFEVTSTASCVDPTDFDTDTAIALCQDRIKDKVWELLGFAQHPNL